MKTFVIPLLLVMIMVSIDRSASISAEDLRGISPQDEKYYKTSSDTIKCRDGSKTFKKSQLNDDFCDCPDGSDEPGTSACPSGKFYCRNAGHAPVTLHSSRVNDGICDCCDGSDEYDGKLQCQNTCWEAGKVARDKLNKKIATYQEGVTLRKQEVEQAKLAIAKDELELSKLKSDEKVLKPLVQQLKAHKEQIEKAEREEKRLQKEKEIREAEEASKEGNKVVEEAENQEGKPTESTPNDMIGLLEDPPSDQDVPQGHDDSTGEVSVGCDNEGCLKNKVELENADHADDVPQSYDDSTGEVSDGCGKEGCSKNKVELENANHADEKDASVNTESLSREELGRLVASRWTGENAGEQTGEADALKDNHENHEEKPIDTPEEEYRGYDSENEDDNHRYDEEEADDPTEDLEDDHDDISSSYDTSSSYTHESESEDMSDIVAMSNPSWLEKIQETVRKVLQAVNLFQTPVNISEAAQVFKEYDDSSSKLTKIQSRISSLERKLKQDFGPDKEFYSFYDKCFELKENKYVYKVCPFKQASQVEGFSTTRLGSWENFEDSYKIMHFSNGDKCWNGPDRSLKVKLRCGLTNELADVDEPSRCEYVALLSTPALCLEKRLQELQEKLDSMNQQQPEAHDEL